MKSSLVAVALVVQLAACTGATPRQGSEAPKGPATARASADAPYAPALFPNARNPPDFPRGTPQGDFQWSARAPRASEAITRWLAYLERHAPKDDVYEDGGQLNEVRAARAELMRAYYLVGDREAADGVLGKLTEMLPPVPCH